MSSMDTFAKQQLINRFQELEAHIQNAEPSPNCELGTHIKSLAEILCVSRIYELSKKEGRPKTLLELGWSIAKQSPIAAAIGFAAYVYGVAQGVF